MDTAARSNARAERLTVAPSIDLGPYVDAPGHTDARELDAADELAKFREQFVEADPTLIYLDGNSLGRLPADTPGRVDRAVRREWGERLIRSWNERWWDLAAVVAAKVAPLVGAGADEVLMADSTSVNLHKLAEAAMGARPGRDRIVTDDLNFPSDVHILDGVADAHHGTLEVVASDGVHGPVAAIEAALDQRTALLSLSLTTYKSGYTYELERLTRMAHDVGALVLWDLSHAIGAVEVDLRGAGADLAVGCTYKYLNGGPGSPAMLFVRRDLQGRLHNPISAWWAHDDPFGFELGFEPDPGIRRFHTGTVPILSLVGAEAGIELVAEAGMAAIRAKSEALVSWAEQCFRSRLDPLGFEWAAPSDPARRGSHAALAHRDAWRITQALIDIGRVIPDFRTPDNIRLGLSPLTTSFVDVHTAGERIARIVEARLQEGYPADRPAVT